MKSNLFWEKISYEQHQWIICVSQIRKWLCLSSGYKVATQNFLAACVCGTTRKEQGTGSKKDWHVRSELIPGSLNAVAPLVQHSKIVFPLLYIKLGIMKQFAKAFEKDGDRFKYIYVKFLGLTIEKLKARKDQKGNERPKLLQFYESCGTECLSGVNQFSCETQKKPN